MTKIKQAFYYIFLPLILLFGFIYQLLSTNKQLKESLKRKQAEKELGETLAKLEEASEDADTKETEFDSAYADYQRAKSGMGKLPEDA